jgi:hypothetical protein
MTTRTWLARIGAGSYLLVLALVTIHLYRTPIWILDMLGYMGNARLHDTTEPVKLHDLVYDELRSSVPQTAFDSLTGAQDQNGSEHDRLVNPLHYVEFLPFFAIRPMYNETIYLLSRTGIGLVWSVRLISAVCYWLLGVLVLIWLGKYTPLSPVLALLIMLMPHITFLGRQTASDALSVLLGMLSLFLIFECDRVAVGICILLTAIWFRTDNVVLVAPVLAVLFYQKTLELWKTAILGAVAVVSVLTINHAAGDYGIQMLYYRNFLGTPMAPGEMTVRFTPTQYWSAFLSGFKTMLNSFVPLFLLFGLIGLKRRTVSLLVIAGAYTALHYFVLPNWKDRWMVIFYLSTSMTAAFGLEPRAILRKFERSQGTHPTQSNELPVSARAHMA